MKKLATTLFIVGGLLGTLGVGLQAQTVIQTPFFTGFADTLKASTYNGEPLVVGSVIQAFDTSGVYCGVDVVRPDTLTGNGIFGFFPVYGDDPGSPEDEGPTDAGEPIIFMINKRPATRVAGDTTWTHNELKSVTLSASATIGLEGVIFPVDRVIKFGDTVHLRVRVHNTGDGLDFYGVKLSMSAPGGTGQYDWEAMEPDTVVYCDAGAYASVYFDVRAPIFNAVTTNMVYYTVFSHLDTTVKIEDSVKISFGLVDVDDPNSSLPDRFTLDQNYPNPFNPTTIIPFNLPARSQTTLEIYNVLGQAVDKLDLGYLSEGPHEVEYDASSLTSGIYFYRLVTEHVTKSRKMVLLK